MAINVVLTEDQERRVRHEAAVKVGGLTHILSFDAGDFARYPGIAAIDPSHL